MRLVYWSLRCTATFVFRFHWSLLLVFSLHFSSSSAFLRSLLTQSSHLICGLPRFLQPSCFFVSDIFGHLSSFILTMCPAHFIRLLTILPTMQALVPTSSRRSFILRLFTLHTPDMLLIQLFSNIQVYVDAVWTELTCPSHTSWHRAGIQDTPLQFSGNISV